MLRESDETSVAQVTKNTKGNEQTLYGWRKRFGGMSVDETRRLKALEIVRRRAMPRWNASAISHFSISSSLNANEFATDVNAVAAGGARAFPHFDVTIAQWVADGARRKL
jgi:hypothetical protein